MHDVLLTGNWTVTLIHIPSYRFFLLALPLLGLVAIKFGGLKQSGSHHKAQSWIPTGEYDENGLPRMSRENSAPHEARMRAAMAAYETKNRR